MISVVMPVYNSEKYLERAIESILNQIYKDIELIIIDDGSTDSSLSLINRYAQMDRRIRVISQKNSGVSAARNAGMSVASGEWLYFMDSDDYVDTTFLQDMMVYSKLYDMLITGVNRHYVNEKKQDNTVVPLDLEITNEAEYGRFLGEIIKAEDQDLFFNYLWNKLIRASTILNKNIRFNEKISLGEDFLFNCDLFEQSIRIKTIPKAYYHYNIHDDSSLSKQFYKNELERRNLVYQRIIDLFSRYSVYDQYRNEIEIREGRFSYYSLLRINNKSCDIVKCEKEKYIAEIIKNRKKYISMYLTHESGIKSRIKRIIILLGNVKLVYLMLLLNSSQNSKMIQKIYTRTLRYK